MNLLLEPFGGESTEMPLVAGWEAPSYYCTRMRLELPAGST